MADVANAKRKKFKRWLPKWTTFVVLPRREKWKADKDTESKDNI